MSHFKIYENIQNLYLLYFDLIIFKKYPYLKKDISELHPLKELRFVALNIVCKI